MSHTVVNSWWFPPGFYEGIAETGFPRGSLKAHSIPIVVISLLLGLLLIVWFLTERFPTLSFHGWAAFLGYIAFQRHPLHAKVELGVSNACQARLVIQDPGCWAASISRDFGVRIELSGFKVIAPELVRELASIELQESGARGLVNVLHESISIDRLRLCRSPPSRLVLLVDDKKCVACNVAARSESVIVTAVYRGRVDAEWTVVSADASSLRSLLMTLREQNCAADVKASSPQVGDFELTDRQMQVLSAAMDMGYFDNPKRAGLPELARRFEISKVSVRELLRKAEKRLLRRQL